MVRATEPDFYMAECFDPQKSHCHLSSACILKDTLHQATAAYLAVLDGATLESLMATSGSPVAPDAVFKSIPIRPQPLAFEKLQTKK